MAAPHAAFLEKHSRTAAYFLLFAACVVLIGWDWIKELLHMHSSEAILGVTIGCFLTLMVYLDVQVTHIVRYFSSGLSHCTLAEGIQSAIAERKHVAHLRIYALTTAKILPIIQSSNPHIDLCDVILPHFPKAKGGSPEAENNAHVDQLLVEWQRMKDIGRIKELRVRFVEHWPSFYCCIFDNDSLLSGLYMVPYHAAPLDSLGIDFTEPALFTPRNPATTMMVSKHNAWFATVFQKGAESK